MTDIDNQIIMDNLTPSKIINRDYVFDPRIITEEESKQLWTTESVELAKKGLADGYELKESPFNTRIKKVQLRRANLPFKYTEEELGVITRCIQDKIWFGNNFTKLKDGDKGWTQIKLRDYQEKILQKYSENRYNILMIPRQSGKTTTTIIEIVHYMTFNFDKDCVVVAQSQKVVNEILDKIKTCFEGLPFFLQPGFKTCTNDLIELDNGCKLKIGVASESVAQGFSLDLLFIDEFAYISDRISEPFWVNIYPTLINNKKSRCIIASTPNGRNLFHKIWTGAVSKSNNFIPTRLYWYEIPGRTEEFKKETIENIGLLGWEMGFECNFDVGMKTIFPTETQKYLRNLQDLESERWLNQKSSEITPIESWLYRNDFRVLSGSNLMISDYYIISVDIAEGLEQDYSVVKLIRLEWSVEKKQMQYRVVATYHHNDVGIGEFTLVLMEMFKQFNPARLRVVIENNTYGGEMFQLIFNHKLSIPEFSGISNDIFVKFRRESKGSYEYGLRWNAYNKPMSVKEYANLVGRGVFIDSYPVSIEESMNFCRKSGNSFAANYGHDDLVMANITAVHFISSSDMFILGWLKTVESHLRYLCNDEPEEIVKERERIQKEKDSLYVSENGYIEYIPNRNKRKNQNLLM